MLKFDGVINRGAFLRASALRLGLFIASVIGFPFLLMGIVSASGCAGVGGACGAVGLLAGTAFKPLAFILFVVSFCGIAVRRARDAGMPGPMGLFIPLLFASNHAFLIYAGAPWQVGFSAGVLFVSFPWASVLALYGILIFCVLPSRPRSAGNPFGTAGLVAIGLGLLIAIDATLANAITFGGVQSWMLQLGRIPRYAGQIAPYAMMAFAAVLALIAWQYRSAPLQVAEPSVPPREPVKPATPPIMWLLVAALVMTLIACVFSFGDDVSMMIPLVLVVNLSSMVLPTLAMYFFLLFGFWMIAIRRTPGSLVVLLLALLPFLHWGYAHWTAVKDHEREAAEIAAVQTRALPHVPTTIVFESQHLEGLRGSWKVPAVDRVISKGAYGSTLTQFERNPPRDNGAKQSAVASLPAEYLLLRVGQSSGFAKARQVYAGAGGPLELRYVDPTHDDLVAVWYRAFNPGPTVLPVLTTSGWYRGSNSVSTNDVDRRVGEFLAAATRTPS